MIIDDDGFIVYQLSMYNFLDRLNNAKSKSSSYINYKKKKKRKKHNQALNRKRK